MKKSKFRIEILLLFLLMAALAISCTNNNQGASEGNEAAVSVQEETATPKLEMSEKLRKIIAEHDDLKDQLAALKKAFVESAPAERVQVYEQGIEALRKAGLEKGAKRNGEEAPLFELPDPTGKPVILAELLKKGPVVLVWYRGGWCPYCNLQLSAMQQALPKIEKLGATLVAVSPQTPDNSLTTQQKINLDFFVLSDSGSKAAAAYGLVYELPEAVAKEFAGRIDLKDWNGDEKNLLPVPATYVIDTDRKIRFAFIDVDYRKRAEPADVLAALEKIQGK